MIEERVNDNWGREGEYKILNENLQKTQHKLRQTEHDLEMFRRETEQKESDRTFKILNFNTSSIRDLYDDNLVDAAINIIMEGYPANIQNKSYLVLLHDDWNQ